MSRSTSQTFTIDAMEQLARQLLFGPVEVRRAQVRRAEELHDQVEDEVDYPFEFIVYRITGSRGDPSDDSEPTVVVGRAVAADLRLLIDLLSKSAPVPLGPGEEAETVNELARRLNVSTRTIWRWRRIGLRWRWAMDEHLTRAVLVYPKLATDRFVVRHGELVAHASGFTQIEPAKKQAIIERARRLAQARPISLNQAAVHLSRRTGRALETIRQILQQHDRDWPDRPIFPGRQGPLTPRQKRVIARAYSWGISATKIARRFSRTRLTITRVVRQRRASELTRRKLRFVVMPTFDLPDAEAVILQPAAFENADAHSPGKSPRRAPAPRLDDLPPALRPIFGHPPLPGEQVHDTLVRLNFLKYKANSLIQRLDKREPSNSLMDQIEATLKLADDAHALLLRAHARLTLSLVRRHLAGQADASTARLLELLTLSRPVLVDAIEQFDPGRGQAFEAFFTWALLRHLASVPAVPRAHKRGDEATLVRWASDQ